MNHQPTMTQRLFMHTQEHACTHHHNVHHTHDPKERLQEAKVHCQSRGVRFTPLREEVYLLI